jgi:hypothetical protein
MAAFGCPSGSVMTSYSLSDVFGGITRTSRRRPGIGDGGVMIRGLSSPP